MPVLALDLTEEEPLLATGERENNDNGNESDDTFDSHDSHPQIRARRWQAKTSSEVIIFLALIKFACVASGMMLLLPFYRLMEDMFCHTYYQDESSRIIEEMECKVDKVQSDLATLNGWMGLLNSVIGLIAAFPFGTMADKIGRKPTLVLAYGGVTIAFGIGPVLLRAGQRQVRQNPYLLMMGSAFQLIGGGIQVLLATLYAIAADVSSEKDKAHNFLYLTFGATAGGLVGPLLAGLLMGRYGPWVPIAIVGIITPFVFVAIAIFLPETKPVTKEEHLVSEDADPSPRSFKDHLNQGVKELAHSLTMVKNINIILVLVTFFVQNARLSAYTVTLPQYLSKHFGWRLSDTSLLLSPLGILNLVLLAVLPKISTMLVSRRFRFTPFGKDLLLTRVSTCIIIVGAIIEAFSHNIVLFIFGLFITTLGAADSPLARATVSHYVDPEFTSRLQALIAMIEVAGSFIGSPVLAWTFNLGMRRKGLWIGLPWFYVGILCAIALAALRFVRAPKKDMRQDPNDHDNIDELSPNDPLRPHLD